MVEVIFAQPGTVNAKLAAELKGRVVVLDLAFDARNFTETTQPFIEALGDRLAAWVDHHPHAAWKNYENDPRFHFFPREVAPACPPVITPELMEKVGAFDTIVAHGDFDGVVSAAVAALGGKAPYAEALEDSIIIDARVPGKIASVRAQNYERAMKGDTRDEKGARLAMFKQLTGQSTPEDDELLTQSIKAYEVKEAETNRLVELYEIRGNVAYVDATNSPVDFDLTQLLLVGQHKAEVAVVKFKSTQDQSLQLSVAAPAPWNFVQMFGLKGGMPNRVILSADRLDEVIATINAPKK